MRLVLLFMVVSGGLFQSGCASPDDPDQVQLGPSITEQRRDARQKEEFARDLPKP